MKFLNNMTLGQYVPVDSQIHSLDPRSKIIATIVCLTGVFLVREPYGFLSWGLFFVLMVSVSRLPGSLIISSSRPVWILIAFTSVIHLFFTKGVPVFSWGFLEITREGLEMAVRMGLRLLMLVLFAGFLTLTTSPTELADGLESLFSPLKRFGFPAHELAMMMTIALRFIPTLLNETERIMKAQIARGADLDRGGPLRRLRAFIPVLVPLFVIVFQRADDLATAMEARNYTGGEGRTRMYPLRWSVTDSGVLMLTLLFAIAVALLEKRLMP
ncbi:MAG: energy-coupling factor transporter transmembrane component T [Thermovirgaceae bacterium]|nr:energy-coupling factor transporter transmembrane component T [Thermovirgaceae bacterium]